MISSLRNPHVQQVRKLAKRGVRDKTGAFLVEGAIGVAEALAARAPVSLLLWEQGPGRVNHLAADAEGSGIRTFEVSPAVMRAVSGTTTPQGIVAVCGFVDRPAEELVKTPGFSVVMADVRDPGNAGTMLRTAWAVGADAVFCGGGTVDPYNPKVVRASAGALFNAPFCREADIPWVLERLGELGVKRIGAVPDAQSSYLEVDMTGPVALVFGNESWGVSDEVARRLDVAASIPMPGGAESLNVGIAAAVFCFEARRQRSL